MCDVRAGLHGVDPDPDPDPEAAAGEDMYRDMGHGDGAMDLEMMQMDRWDSIHFHWLVPTIFDG